MKIIDLLINSFEAKPDRIAMKSDRAEISYRQMLSDVVSLSEQLKRAGCKSGVKVAIALRNSFEYLISFFAISAADGIILLLSNRMTPYETAEYIKKADVSILITNEFYGRKLSEAISDVDNITIIYAQYDVDEYLNIEIKKSGKCKTDKQNSDVALFVLTSGATGTPKIVMLTDDNLISNMIDYRTIMNFDDHNVVYCALSFHHIYCICAQLLTHISLGDTFVICDSPFFAKDFLRAVEKYQVTITAFVPYMAMLLAEYPEPSEFDLKSLKFVTLSGSKTPELTYNLLSEKYSTVRFINTYGMSEAGSRISLAAPYSQRFPVESVGRPMPSVSVEILDDKGNMQPVDCPGEICVKSSGVMKGYYKQPELTAGIIINGRLRTGDIGKIDKNGNLFILGRIKDTIISGGENLSPAEIEECLSRHPSIREVAVVGREHQLLQEIPYAFVVKKNTSENLTPIEIIEFCKNRLSGPKIPRSIQFIEQLPRLGTAKIDRDTLKKMAAEPL